MTAQKIVGVFDNENEASKAIETLQANGIDRDAISVIGKEKDDVTAVTDQTGTKAVEGAATGAATGGVLGGVAGLLASLGALAIPGIGPILAAGPIVATLTGAAVGAGAGGLVGGLVGLGIPEEEAREYDAYVQEGKLLVLVDADESRRSFVEDIFHQHHSLNESRYDGAYVRAYDGAVGGSETATDHAYTESAASAELGTAEERSIPLREERLDVEKTREQTGEVTVRKEVIEEEKTLHVPVSREEVVIERRPVSDFSGQSTTKPIGDNETIRIPVSEEKVNVHKDTVVTGEVAVGKRQIQETEQVQDTVKREEVRVERDGETEINADLSYGADRRNDPDHR